MPYRIKIGNQQYEADIEGTQEWSRSVTRDFNDRLFRTRGGYRFTGHEGLYNLLYNHISLNSVCEPFIGRIYFNTGSGWDYEWRGEIKPQDWQFDLLKRNVEGQVLDASWSAKFNNSQNQKVFLESATSGTGTAIQSCPSALCDFYDPDGGAYSYTDRKCYRVFDVFNFLVRYHTGGTVTFTSTFFDIGGDGEQWYITTGEEIRLGESTANPELSFEDVFDETNKKFNLWIVIEGTQDAPVLRIEEWDYVFKQQKLLDIVDPESIELTVDLDQLYSVVSVGSTEQEFDIGNDADYPTVRFNAWNNEEYNANTSCTFEGNTLDLVSGWTIDTNAIQKTLGGSEDYDDSIFLVEIDPSTLNAYQFTTEYTQSSTVTYIYNFNLTNAEVLANWFNGIPTDIAKDISKDYNVYVDSPIGGKFSGSFNDVIFTNDSTAPATDVDDIYTTPTEDPTFQGQFKAPVNSVYTVTGTANITNGTFGLNVFRLDATIYKDDTRNEIIGGYALGGPRQYLVNENFTLQNTKQIYMDAGWVMVVRINALLTTGAYKYTLNTASCSFTSPSINYELSTDDPLIYVYKIGNHKFSRANFNTLDQGQGFVRILDTNANKAYDVWAKDVKYNSTTGVVEVGEFIGGSPPTELCWVLETGYWNDECWWLDVEQLVENETDWFIFTVDTTVPAKTNNDQFEFPLVGSANLLIDWGDGQVETGVTSTTTHTYGSTGTYTIKVAGTWTRFAFLTAVEDNDKMQTIEQWGVIGWGAMGNAFASCGNLTANYTDTPRLVNCSDFLGAFANCTNFNGDVGGFDMSSATNLTNMFLNCTSFNNGGSDSIKDWNFNSVSGNIAMAGTFSGCTAFNQPLTNWATNRVTSFSQFLYNCTNFDQPLNHFRFDICTNVFWMLRDCTSFDQNVEDWNMDTRPVGTYTGIMRGDTLSTANYDALLVGWLGWSGGAPTKTLPSNRTGVNFGNSTYSLGSDADDARDYLINTLSWAITDGGGV